MTGLCSFMQHTEKVDGVLRTDVSSGKIQKARSIIILTKAAVPFSVLFFLLLTGIWSWMLNPPHSQVDVVHAVV